jgi:hypothetical protein
VVVLSALLLGYGGLTILPPLGSQAGAYLADRNIGLAVLLVVLLILGWTRCLAALLLTTAGMHYIDAAADTYLQNVPAAAGSLVVAVISTIAALWLFGQARIEHQTD